MKKIRILLFLLVVSNLAYGQDQKETVDQFFELVNCKGVLSHGFLGIESYVAAKKEGLFEDYELDFSNQTDVAAFDSLLHERIQMFERDAYVSLHSRYYYDYPPEQVESYLALANSRSYEDILIESNFKKEVDSLNTYLQPYIVEEVHLIMTKIRAKYQPLVLKIIANAQEVPISSVDLDLLLNTDTEQNKQFSILDPSTAQIALPEAFDFETMISLTIRLNGKDYTIDRYDRNFPEPLQEVFSPLRKESFEDLEFWILTIDNKELRLKTKVETTVKTLSPNAEEIPNLQYRQLLIDSLQSKGSASLPDAIALSQQADEFTAFCDQLREEIISRTGGYGPDHKPVGLANKAEVNKLFLDEKQAEVLRDKMAALRAAMLHITSNQIDENQIATGALLRQGADKCWEEYTFRNMPAADVLPLLANFRNDAMRDEITILEHLLTR